jgi:hemerythrin-like domain-containing protein
MVILPSSARAPSFDDPLEMIQACHEKILRQCDTLRKLGPHLDEHGCDEAAQQAAQGILRYFDTAGMFHHQDEELDLFPTLRACENTDQAHLQALLERLLAEHIVMMSAWNELRVVLLTLAGGTGTLLNAELSERFIGYHTAHIEIEEAELIPLAARTLSMQQLEPMGKRMAQRRVIK